MKHPQTKFHSVIQKLLGQKKSKFIVRTKFSCSRVFFINILLKLQQILLCFWNF